MPNHPRSRYDYLGAILEHMDNSKRIDPIQIVIHDEQQVHAGPSGVSRLFALTHQRQYTHIPCIVNSTIHYEWFGEGVVKVNTTEELLSYFDPQYLPKSYEVDENGVAWHNGAWSYEELERTMNVSIETKLRMKQMMTETN
jgi:hypothetical protein